MSRSVRREELDETISRMQRVEQLFIAALDLPTGQRTAFLDRECRGDDELRREVDELLAAERQPSMGFPDPSRIKLLEMRKLRPRGFDMTERAAPGHGRDATSDLHPSLKGLPLAPGMQIGRYKLLRTVGRGGMGTVFLAQDTRLHRQVAIKFLHAATSETTARFLAEARTTARCKHENIVVIHDVDEIDGYPYMVLEHLEGESLRHRLVGLIGGSDTASATPAARRREARAVAPAMPIASVLDLVIPMVRALACAHTHGIVHRDLKPENVFLCSNGAVKVLDFGIAKALTRLDTASQAVYASTKISQEQVLTGQGALLGTLPYMSPEQWGADEIDARTDLWAVGIMLYEMLVGQHPLAPLSYNKLQTQVPALDLPMPRIGTAVPGLDKLADIVDSCLRKHKSERIVSAETLLDALEEVHAGVSIGAGEAARDDAPKASLAITQVRTLSLDSEPKQPCIIDFTGERGRHEHFFGRKDILHELDGWLRGRDSGWLLLTGSSGLGKSAIFNHWLRLREQAGLPVAFHFVRRDIQNWADPATVSASLAAQIERDFPEQRDVSADPTLRLEQLLQRVSHVLEQRQQELVLLVDGLDEVWTLDDSDNPIPRIFPQALPRHVFVYAASRSSYPHLAWFMQRAEPWYTIKLDGQPGNLETVREFWAALRGTLSPPLTDDLMRVAVERSEGNLLQAVKLYQLWSQAGAERSMDATPQPKTSSGLREPHGDRRHRIARWRKHVFAAGLAVTTVVTIGLGMRWQRPAVSIPPLSAPGGVVVTGGRLNNGERDAWQHLCTALREYGEQAVQCVAPPAPPDEELVAAARAAGASLVITVEAGPVARVLPVPGRDGELFLRGLPAVSIARPETRIALAQIAYVLALGPREAPSGAAARLPIEPERVMPWRLTALAALARMWTQAAWDNRDRAELAGIARRCHEEPTSLADAHCALIYYVLYAEVAPEDADAGQWLDELVARGPRGIADVVSLYVLRRHCINDPARTRRELLALAERVHGCERWYLMTPATCVLMVGDRSGEDNPGNTASADDIKIHMLAEPGEHAGDWCPDDVRADAYYDRAHWLAETWNASTREEWEQAVESYELAFRLDPRADYAQGLAEALLFLQRLVPERAGELARRAVEVLERAAVEAPTAAFLTWLSGDAAGRTRLCAIYHALPRGGVAVPYVSRRLACPSGDQDASLSCTVHRLLSTPKLAGGGVLGASFCAGDGDAQALKSDERTGAR